MLTLDQLERRDRRKPRGHLLPPRDWGSKQPTGRSSVESEKIELGSDKDVYEDSLIPRADQV